jgi:hypothetical protein
VPPPAVAVPPPFVVVPPPGLLAGPAPLAVLGLVPPEPVPPPVGVVPFVLLALPPGPLLPLRIAGVAGTSTGLPMSVVVLAPSAAVLPPVPPTPLP